MKRRQSSTLTFVLLLLSSRTCLCVEPISSTIAATIGALGLATIYSTWDYLKCSSQECCHRSGDVKRLVVDGVFRWSREPWIDYDLQDLDSSLNAQLHGQHLAKSIIIKLIRRHVKNENPEKALVLSFHGWTGSGKNFVSDIIARSLYRRYRDSGRSDFVHKVICTHFNTNDKQVMRQWIKDNVTDAVKACHRSLFIFDEIDKLPDGVIDAIKPFVDYNNYVDSLDYRKSIFIFLSNTGGTGITRKTYDFHLLGKDRADLKMKDLEPVVNSGAFNENGGLYKSDIVEKNLIDAYVPFLPLEKKHIRLCIIDYLKEHYNMSDPIKQLGEELIREVSEELEYYPPDTRLYSKTGCKRVANKVDLHM